MTLQEHVAHWWAQLQTWLDDTPTFRAPELEAAVGVVDSSDDAVIGARVQRALLGLIKSELDAQPSWNQSFKKSTGVKIVDQLLTAARLKELLAAKIVKRGGAKMRVDCSELGETYYGRQVMTGLGLSKQRKILDRAEYDKVAAEFAKIKLTLPELIEPTTTERFFGGD